MPVVETIPYRKIVYVKLSTRIRMSAEKIAAGVIAANPKSIFSIFFKNGILLNRNKIRIEINPINVVNELTKNRISNFPNIFILFMNDGFVILNSHSMNT
jgi:hypothetical protein